MFSVTISALQLLKEADATKGAFVDLMDDMVSMLPFTDAVQQNELQLKVKWTWKTVRAMLDAVMDATRTAVKYYQAGVAGKLQY